MKNCNAIIEQKGYLEEYFLKDNGSFPNNILPVLIYKQVLKLPLVFRGLSVRKKMQQQGWTNNWKAGIYTYHHYHSNTHEAMAVIKGQTTLLLGGENGMVVMVKQGDLLVIPAGVAHKNLGRESSVTCIGGYPEGPAYDMNYGKPGERPGTDKNIALVKIPSTGPLCGADDPLIEIWTKTWKERSHAKLSVV